MEQSQILLHHLVSRNRILPQYTSHIDSRRIIRLSPPLRHYLPDGIVQVNGKESVTGTLIGIAVSDSNHLLALLHPDDCLTHPHRTRTHPLLDMPDQLLPADGNLKGTLGGEQRWRLGQMDDCMFADSLGQRRRKPTGRERGEGAKKGAREGVWLLVLHPGGRTIRGVEGVLGVKARRVVRASRIGRGGKVERKSTFRQDLFANAAEDY